MSTFPDCSLTIAIGRCDCYMYLINVGDKISVVRNGNKLWKTICWRTPPLKKGLGHAAWQFSSQEATTRHSLEGRMFWASIKVSHSVSPSLSLTFLVTRNCKSSFKLGWQNLKKCCKKSSSISMPTHCKIWAAYIDAPVLACLESLSSEKLCRCLNEHIRH